MALTGFFPWCNGDLYTTIARLLDLEVVDLALASGLDDASITAINRVSLSHLSPEWRQQLQQAATCLDQAACLGLIQQLPADFNNLTEHLPNLVTDFRFDVLLALIQNSQ